MNGNLKKLLFGKRLIIVVGILLTVVCQGRGNRPVEKVEAQAVPIQNRNLLERWHTRFVQAVRLAGMQRPMPLLTHHRPSTIRTTLQPVPAR